MPINSNTQIFSTITFVDKLLFTKHVSVMIKSGIPLIEALDMMASQMKSDKFRTVIVSISNDVKNGESFSKALRKHPKVFNTFYTSLIEIGESSGTLEDTLNYLSDQLAKDYAFQKKVKGALMYPTIVFSAASIVGFSIAIFVLPKLIDLFKDFDVKLPLTTQILIWFANLMKNYGILIGIGTIGLIILGKYIVSLPKVKPYWHRFLLLIPIFGSIMRNSQLTTLFRTLGIMLKSGLPITSALDIEYEMSTNLVFKKYISQLRNAVNRGKTLSAELETGKYTMVPSIATKMVAVGERTGKLDETFLYLEEFFEAEVDDATKNLSTVLEPVMLLFIGAIVAFIALAIISPIYQLTGSIQR
jgi:type IV pilus assembly protein PilC